MTCKDFYVGASRELIWGKENYGVSFIFPLKRLKPTSLIFPGNTTILHTTMNEGAHLSG